MIQQIIHPLLVSNGAKPRRGAVTLCATCKEEFYTQQCRLKGERDTGHNKTCGPRKFCSRACAHKALLTNTPQCCAICSNPFYVSKSQQKYRTRETCSKPCKFALIRLRAEKRRAEQGYTKHQLDRLARYSPEAALWRKAVFKRDDYTCQVCRERGGRLEADHIKPFAFFPELRYELSNGRTLCRKCHNKTKMPASKMREIYSIAVQHPPGADGREAVAS